MSPTAFATGLLLCAGIAAAADGGLFIELEAGPGTGDQPMIMVWLERLDGSFVRTLQIFSGDHKYYHEMTLWAAARANVPNDRVDAVIGPTVKWNSSRSALLPRVVGGVDLLDGNHQIHVEQRRDKGGHYKKLRIPLPAGFTTATVNGEGYLKRMTVTVRR